MILQEMEAVYNQVKDRRIIISEMYRDMREVVIPALFASHEQLELAREWVDEFINTLDRKLRASLAYVYKRQDIASDYSVLKLLYKQSFFKRPVKLVWNASVSFYHES